MLLGPRALELDTQDQHNVGMFSMVRSTADDSLQRRQRRNKRSGTVIGPQARPGVSHKSWQSKQLLAAALLFRLLLGVLGCVA